jgi:hypothetical protein
VGDAAQGRVAHSWLYDGTENCGWFLWREILGEVLGARKTGNADLPWRDDNKLAACKLVSVILHHGIEVFDLGLQVSSWKSKEDDAGVDESLVEDQLTEIAVGNEQNPLLFPSDGKDILISKTRGVLARDRRNVMAKLAKVGNQPEISALVEQESHTGVALDRAPLGGFGETSSPVTIALA